METRTVKLRKALPNMSRKIMPTVVVATKYSQGEKDLGDPEICPSLIVSRFINVIMYYVLQNVERTKL